MFSKIFIIALMWAVMSAHECKYKKTKQKHILIFVADDWGWNDWGVHGSNEMRTCNLDAFGYRSIIMDNYYSMALCTPSRAALMTGKHPARTGVQYSVLGPGQPWGLPQNETILPQCLKNDGYVTYAVGKWHLGDCITNYLPTKRGFDYHSGYWEGNGDYFHHNITVPPGYDFHENTEPDFAANGTYSTDLYTEKAVQLIESHDLSKPMFMFVGQQNVHAPVEAPAEAIDQFPYVANTSRRTFDGMLLKMDQSFGEIIAALQRKRILEDTIIVVISDNGGAAGGYDESIGSNWPLKGCKGNYFQAGCRLNAMFWSSNLCTSRVEKGMMHVVDWFPTLLHAINSSCLTNGVLDDIDGINLWPLLKGEKTCARTDILLQKDTLGAQFAYIEGDYKLLMGNWSYSDYYTPTRELTPAYDIRCIENSKVARAFRSLRQPIPSVRRSLELRASVTLNCSIYDCNDAATRCVPCNPINSTCLYNIKDDPCELTNIAEDRPDIVARLRQKLNEFPERYPVFRPRDPRAVQVWNQFNDVITPWCDYVDCGTVA